jgi:hypothetical protein
VGEEGGVRKRDGSDIGKTHKARSHLSSLNRTCPVFRPREGKTDPFPEGVDCEGMAKIVLVRGLILTLDDNQAGPNQTADVDEYDELGYTTAPITTQRCLPALSRLEEGDWAYFVNDPRYMSWPSPIQKRPYQGENVIALGTDSFYGYPLGPQSYAGWIKTLSDKAAALGIPNPLPLGYVTTPNAYVNTPYPVHFLNVSAIAMKVFDLRMKLLVQ